MCPYDVIGRLHTLHLYTRACVVGTDPVFLMCLHIDVGENVGICLSATEKQEEEDEEEAGGSP